MLQHTHLSTFQPSCACVYIFDVLPEAGVAREGVAADLTYVQLRVGVFVTVAEQLDLGG